MAGGGGMGGNSSSQDIQNRSGAGSIGTGEQSFYFGGNPNVASALNNKWLIVGACVVAVFFFLRRK